MTSWKNVLPAVVTIESNQKVSMAKAEIPGLRGKPFGDLPGLPDELRERSLKNSSASRSNLKNPSLGSIRLRIIVDPKGVILTNEHVVHGAKRVEVHLQDGRKFFSKNIKTDPKTDLAIVKLDVNESLPALEMGTATPWKSAIAFWRSAAPLE